MIYYYLLQIFCFERIWVFVWNFIFFPHILSQNAHKSQCELATWWTKTTMGEYKFFWKINWNLYFISYFCHYNRFPITFIAIFVYKTVILYQYMNILAVKLSIPPFYKTSHIQKQPPSSIFHGQRRCFLGMNRFWIDIFC